MMKLLILLSQWRNPLNAVLFFSTHTTPPGSPETSAGSEQPAKDIMSRPRTVQIPVWTSFSLKSSRYCFPIVVVTLLHYRRVHISSLASLFPSASYENQGHSSKSFFLEDIRRLISAHTLKGYRGLCGKMGIFSFFFAFWKAGKKNNAWWNGLYNIQEDCWQLYLIDYGFLVTWYSVRLLSDAI